jgi:uncharacterized protein (DUF433 family)
LPPIGYTLPMIPAFIVRDPKILGGAPVFAGTEVPFRTLVEYRHAGLPLYEFLLDFPAVRREQGKKAWAWLLKQEADGVEQALGISLKPKPPPAPGRDTPNSSAGHSDHE